MGRSLFCILIAVIVSTLFVFLESTTSKTKSVKEKRLIKVIPVAGILGMDIRRVTSYVDHDPKHATLFSKYGLGKNNIKDYMGGDQTYDGHAGTDIGIASFEEQDIGVPIVAVLKGVVKKTLDGVFDRETTKPDIQGNFVLIDHGNGIESYYNHLQKGSVMVSVGDHVKTGQQIGRMGSSGGSTWPHLHFEWRENGKKIDPFSGPYNKIRSRFVNQPPYKYPMTISDCGLYYLDKRKKIPFVTPRQHYAKRGESKKRKLKLWIHVLNIKKKKHTRKWKLISPDKKYVNEWTDIIDGSKSWYGLGASVWRYHYSFGFSQKSTKGIWTMEIYHDGKIKKIISVDVADSDLHNRAPGKPTGGTIAPSRPRVSDYITCKVKYQRKSLDPDLDRIRYRFEWNLNGKVVRNVTNATRLDYFPASTAKAADKLVCRIFASDGRLESRPVVLSLIYRR